jgi:C-terminal processing protease CtpA/Prc
MMPENISRFSGWTIALLLLAFTAVGCSFQPAVTAPAADIANPVVEPTAVSNPVENDTCLIEPLEPPECPAPELDITPVLLRGEFTYTNDIVLERYYVQHSVALMDMTGFILRDLDWELPVEGQTLGYIEVDIENKRGSFRLQLPAQPEGIFHNVDPEDDTQVGVQVFTLGYMGNLTGGPFSEGDDRSQGWPGYLTSTRLSADTDREVIGGKLIVWAPDAEQSFPTGFGADGKLFTNDDPVGPLPAGYSVVNLDQEPFELLRDPEVELVLHEPTDLAVKDYSAMSYSEAFETMFAKVRVEYAFNGIEGKQPDWDALYAELAPRVADAERDKDRRAFFRALQEFTYAFNDGHVSISSDGFRDLVWQPVSGGYGVSVRELDNGQVIAAFILSGSPADQAGMQSGAVITAVNGVPVKDAIQAVKPISAPHSTDFTRRFEQVRFLLRAAPGTTASVSFINPGASERTATMQAVDEIYSYLVTAQHFTYNPYAPPVEYWFLQSGIGYIRVNTNSDDLYLTLRLFERALKTFQDNDAAGLIIDMRNNSGGAPLGMAGYLTKEDIPLGSLQYYNEKTGQFEARRKDSKITPFQNQYSFRRMALLVDQTCYSACEIEAYGFSQLPGMQVIGYYPTAGVEAEVARGQYKLPEDITVRVPTGRFVLPDGSIFLEGVGVEPTIRVPINSDSILAQYDYVLSVAEATLLRR